MRELRCNASVMLTLAFSVSSVAAVRDSETPNRSVCHGTRRPRYSFFTHCHGVALLMLTSNAVRIVKCAGCIQELVALGFQSVDGLIYADFNNYIPHPELLSTVSAALATYASTLLGVTNVRTDRIQLLGYVGTGHGRGAATGRAGLTQVR